MTTSGQESTRYQVRLTVPRRGGVLAWGAVSGDFEQRLAAQESPAVIAARVESQTRRGRDYVRVVMVMTVAAPDVAEAVDAAWWAFREAASDDLSGLGLGRRDGRGSARRTRLRDACS